MVQDSSIGLFYARAVTFLKHSQLHNVQRRASLLLASAAVWAAVLLPAGWQETGARYGIQTWDPLRYKPELSDVIIVGVQTGGRTLMGTLSMRFPCETMQAIGTNCGHTHAWPHFSTPGSIPLYCYHYYCYRLGVFKTGSKLCMGHTVFKITILMLQPVNRDIGMHYHPSPKYPKLTCSLDPTISSSKSAGLNKQKCKQTNAFQY